MFRAQYSPYDSPKKSNLSDKTYAYEFSPVNLKTIRWEFKDSVEAKLFATFHNQPDREFLIGLDGIDRMFPIGEHDFPVGIRERQIDSQNFLFGYDTITNQPIPGNCVLMGI